MICKTSELLKKARKQKGLTQAQVTCVPLSTYKKYEQGLIEPSFLVVVTIFKHMGYDIQEAYKMVNGK